MDYIRRMNIEWVLDADEDDKLVFEGGNDQQSVKLKKTKKTKKGKKKKKKSKKSVLHDV